MGNDDGGPTPGNALDGPLDGSFRLGVEGTGWFVKQEDSGVADDGTGEGDALFLSTGELSTAVTGLRKNGNISSASRLVCKRMFHEHKVQFPENCIYLSIISLW